MTKNTKSLHFYSNIFDNFDILKDSGILSNERIEEIKNYCAKDKFEKTILQGGRKLDNWVTHIPSGKVFAQTALKNSYYWLCNSILEDFLTQEEVDSLNKDASQRYSEVKEQEKFEKAEKIKEEDWDGPVYSEGYGWNDGYFGSIDDFYDDVRDDSEYDEEFTMPKYLWTCDVSPTCIINIDSVLENLTEEAHENFDYRDLNGLDELRAAVDKFNKLNEDNVSWTPNFKKCVILNK